MEKIFMLLVASYLVAVTSGRSLTASSGHQIKESKKSLESGRTTVTDLGELPTLHAVGIATNPNNQDQLIFADETALYELNKNSGKSEMISGQPSLGLLSMRTSADGTGLAASFKFITKIISRPSGLYIFDYDSLRKYDYDTKKVETITQLPVDSEENKPIIGVVSSDENLVYWTTTFGEGHMVMKLALDSSSTKPVLVTGGPTLIGHMELSADEEFLLLADVEMLTVEKVKIQDGEVSSVTQYQQEDFFPGAMAVNGEDLYVINREMGSVEIYDITDNQPTSRPLCDSACLDEISNPFDVIYDSVSNKVFVLDGAFHPSLPTYIFNIKSIDMGGSSVLQSPSGDVRHLMQAFSRWLSEMKQA